MEKIKVYLSFFLLLGFFLLPGESYGQNYALRFYGHGVNNIDRVRIPLDGPHRKLDVGGDFTIEFQMKALLADNPQGSSATQGANDDWTLGHVMIDRDIFGAGDYGDYGISLAYGKIAFGVNNGTAAYTLIGASLVADGSWHHIALTRSSTTGGLQIFVDGVSDDIVYSTSVTGDVSYRDGRPITGNGTWVNEPFLVLGAEKHDYDNNIYPSYHGLMDELRISSTVRYTSNYTPVSQFSDDAGTMALYHFDEGAGTVLTDGAYTAGTTTNGALLYGGSNPSGPVWEAHDSGAVKLNRVPVPLYFDTVQDAFAMAAEGEEIMLRADAVFSEQLLLARKVTVTLSGGYDPAFTSVIGAALLHGSLTISGKAVIAVEGLVIE